MRYMSINLKESFPRLPKDIDLQLYLADNDPEYALHFSRPLVVVLPGGGYSKTSPREAEPIALAYLAAGYQVALLHYHCDPDRYPLQLLEACASIVYCRKNAKDLFADPDRIYVCGFSAGGHLAASTGVLWKQPVVSEMLGVEAKLARPDGMILSYPVITSDPTFTHAGSIRSLLGEQQNDPEMLELVSLEKQVDFDTPPAFIWTTFDDQAVPCKNSLVMASALREHNVPFELHVFPHGVHGLALSKRVTAYDGKDSELVEPVCAEWMEMSIRWIGDRF